MKTKLTPKMRALIAKAISYGFERGSVRMKLATDDALCTKEKAYAAKWVPLEWTDWKSEIPHFLSVASADSTRAPKPATAEQK